MEPSKPPLGFYDKYTHKAGILVRNYFYFNARKTDQYISLLPLNSHNVLPRFAHPALWCRKNSLNVLVKWTWFRTSKLSSLSLLLRNPKEQSLNITILRGISRVSWVWIHNWLIIYFLKKTNYTRVSGRSIRVSFLRVCMLFLFLLSLRVLTV